MKQLITLLVFVVAATIANAQDRIIKQDKSEILAKVEEVGIHELKYRKQGNLTGPLYAIAKVDVYKVIYANGSEEFFGVNELAIKPGEERYFKQAITLRPFSPVIGYLALGYQKSIKPNQAIVGELGFIGPNIGGINDADQSGACVKFGYRMKHLPTVLTPNMEWGHNMGGFYFQPEIAFSSYSAIGYDHVSNLVVNPSGYSYYTYNEVRKRVKVNSFAVMMGLGKQMIFGDVFTVDLGISIGYGLTDASENLDRLSMSRMHFTHTELGRSSVVAKGNLSIGILLK